MPGRRTRDRRSLPQQPGPPRASKAPRSVAGPIARRGRLAATNRDCRPAGSDRLVPVVPGRASAGPTPQCDPRPAIEGRPASRSARGRTPLSYVTTSSGHGQSGASTRRHEGSGQPLAELDQGVSTWRGDRCGVRRVEHRHASQRRIRPGTEVMQVEAGRQCRREQVAAQAFDRSVLDSQSRLAQGGDRTAMAVF